MEDVFSKIFVIFHFHIATLLSFYTLVTFTRSRDSPKNVINNEVSSSDNLQWMDSRWINRGRFSKVEGKWWIRN